MKSFVIAALVVASTSVSAQHMFPAAEANESEHEHLNAMEEENQFVYQPQQQQTTGYFMPTYKQYTAVQELPLFHPDEQYQDSIDASLTNFEQEPAQKTGLMKTIPATHPEAPHQAVEKVQPHQVPVQQQPVPVMHQVPQQPMA